MDQIAARSLHVSKLLPVSIDLVWEAWTNPSKLTEWWGPNGFTTTIHQMDLVEGGEWKLTLHGPDGTNFANRSIFKAIIPHQKIQFEHFNPSFITTVLFGYQGMQTKVDWAMQFETAEMRDIIVKAHRADEGLKQNVERLENFLTKG